MAIALIACLLGLGFLGPYVGVRLARRRVAGLRAGLPGNLIRLSQGYTHATWRGPRTGPVMVCVHGLSTPSFVWGPLAPLLARLGYRVLTYDLYGRGFSDRAPGRQDADFFLRQLEDLLAYEGVSTDITLVGYSMGGAISSAFAAKHPDQVKRLILLAPAGLSVALGSFSDFAASTPVLGDWAMEVLGARVLRNGYVKGSDPDPVADEITRRALDELAISGTLRAILSAQRGILSVDQSDLHRGLADAGVPTVAIWGARDVVIPLASRDRLAMLNPDADQITLSDADHRLTYTHPEQLAELIGPPT